MRLLVLARADLDVQQSPSDRPTRLTRDRASAYLGVLQRQRADEDRPVTFVGRLDGVIAPEKTDRRDFRLTLHERWRRLKVIRGPFDTDLTDVMKNLLLSDVVVLAEVQQRTRGERKSTHVSRRDSTRARRCAAEHPRGRRARHRLTEEGFCAPLCSFSCAGAGSGAVSAPGLWRS